MSRVFTIVIHNNSVYLNMTDQKSAQMVTYYRLSDIYI